MIVKDIMGNVDEEGLVKVKLLFDMDRIIDKYKVDWNFEDDYRGLLVVI